MKKGLTLAAVNAALKAKGLPPMSRGDLHPTPRIILKRKHHKRIEELLNEVGIVCLRRVKSNPHRFEFVNPKFVTITQGRFFNNPENARAALTHKRATRQTELPLVSAGRTDVRSHRLTPA